MIFHAPLGGFQPVQRRESAFLFGCWGGDTVMVMCVLNLRRDPSFSLIFRYTIVNWWTLHPNWETSQGSCLGPLLSFGIQRIFHLLTLQPSGNISPKLGDLEKKMLLIMILGLYLDPITKQSIVHTAFILSCKSWRKPRRNSAEARSGWQKLTRLHRSLKGIHLRGIWVAVPWAWRDLMPKYHGCHGCPHFLGCIFLPCSAPHITMPIMPGIAMGGMPWHDIRVSSMFPSKNVKGINLQVCV